MDLLDEIVLLRARREATPPNVQVFQANVFGVPTDFSLTTEPGQITISCVMPYVHYDAHSRVLRVFPPPRTMS